MEIFQAVAGVVAGVCFLVLIRAVFIWMSRPWCYGQYSICGYVSPRCETCRHVKNCEEASSDA